MTIRYEDGYWENDIYKKVKAITGQSVTEFINGIRIKKAARLMIEHKLSVKEAAYVVGYSSSNAFYKSFKKHLNMSPSKFIESQKV